MLLVIGLDCAPPALVFDRLRARMPSVAALARRGAWGALRSTVPPITIPAWACMVSGRDPGELGVYGFRSRIEGTRGLRVATADDVRAPRVWDVLGAAGKRCAVLYVPPTWPPRAIENGDVLSCLLTPGPDAPHAIPESLGRELEARFGPHAPDVARAPRGASARDDDGDGALFFEALHDAITQHFDVAEHVLATRAPDFLMMVEMATDRLHHAAWPALDPGDPRHDPSAPAVREARDVYAYLDARIGRLVERAGPEATVMIVSDHGARPLLGGVYVNEWLRQEGWLVLRSEPREPVPIERADVDWSRTRAWAEGGYFARVTLNVRGRFADGEGAIEEGELERALASLEGALGAMRGRDGRTMRNRVVRPRDAYRSLRGTPPDLMVFFDDLDRRALGEVGGGRVHAGPDEAGASGGRGADGCNHDWDGVFVLAGPGVERAGERAGAHLHDVGVTALRLMGAPVPEGWLGRDLRELPLRASAHAPSGGAP